MNYQIEHADILSVEPILEAWENARDELALFAANHETEDNPTEERKIDLIETYEAFDAEFTELESIRASIESIGGGDHEHDGVWYADNLVSADHFRDYAEELARDCHNMPDVWPFRCIDWDQVSDELKNDYTCITIDGVDYYGR